jgi:hypothetical protein
MHISLQEEHTTGTPVVKRTAIGETFIGAIIKFERRDVLRDGQPVLKDNGKPRQELVLHLIAMPGTTAPAGIRDDVDVPAPGEPVRMILRGRSYGDWIEATRNHTLHVGDVVTQVTDRAVTYSASGAAEREITTQAELDSVPRGKTVGVYGSLAVRSAAPPEAAWVQLAEAAYMAADRTPLAAGNDYDDLV